MITDNINEVGYLFEQMNMNKNYEMNQSYPLIQKKTYKMRFDFFKDIANVCPSYEEVLSKRIKKIFSDHYMRYSGIQSEEEFIKYNYEILFGENPLPIDCVRDLEMIIRAHHSSMVMDLCCSNSYHMFMLRCITGLRTIGIDFEQGFFNWIDPYVASPFYMLNRHYTDHSAIALYISSLPLDDAGVEIVKNYRGNLIIYNHSSKDSKCNKQTETLKLINNSYIKTHEFTIETDWNYTSYVQVFEKGT